MEMDLTPLYDAALPKNAPGAWVRQAIEEMARAAYLAAPPLGDR